MQKFTPQNSKMVEDANGEFVQITEGQIQKGDVIQATNFGLFFLKTVIKVSKINAFVVDFGSNSSVWEVSYNRNIETIIAKEKAILKEVGRNDQTVKVFRKISK